MPNLKVFLGWAEHRGVALKNLAELGGYLSGYCLIISFLSCEIGIGSVNTINLICFAQSGLEFFCF